MLISRNGTSGLNRRIRQSNTFAGYLITSANLDPARDRYSHIMDGVYDWLTDCLPCISVFFRESVSGLEAYTISFMASRRTAPYPYRVTTPNMAGRADHRQSDIGLAAYMHCCFSRPPSFFNSDVWRLSCVIRLTESSGLHSLGNQLSQFARPGYT